MVAGPARPATFDAIDGVDLTPLILEMASSLHNWGESSQLYKQFAKGLVLRIIQSRVAHISPLYLA